MPWFSVAVWHGLPSTAAFSTSAPKIHYVLGLLRGRALAWAEAVSSRLDFSSLQYREFEARLKAVFDHPGHCENASHLLAHLQQGDHSVADYSVEFWILAADAQWNDSALRATFIKGLNEQLQDQLATLSQGFCPVW